MKHQSFFKILFLLITTTIAGYLIGQEEVEFNSNGITFPRVSTASVTSPVEGQVVYDTDTDELMIYNGTAWVSPGAAGFWAPSTHGIEYDNTDNIGVGVAANSGTKLFVQGDYNEDPFRIQIGVESDPNAGGTKFRILAKYNSVVLGSSWNSIDSSNLNSLWSNYRKNYIRDSLYIGNPTDDPSVVLTKSQGIQLYDSNGDTSIDLDKESGLASVNDLSVSEEASFGKGLLSSDPIKLREIGNGPAGPEILFMDDNSTINNIASIKVTNSTGGGNNHNLLIDNRSPVGDISFIADGGKTHFRIGNENNFSYFNLSPWIDNTTDLGLTSKRWRNIYSEDLDINGTASLEDLSVSEEASFGKGLLSSDPIKLREIGNGPAGPEILFMDDNSTTNSIASIKVTNSTGGGSDHDLLIENKSLVGDITFIADGGDPHFRMGNGNNFSYYNLSPWLSNTHDLGSSGKRWRTIYSQNSLNTSDIRLKKNIEAVSESILPQFMQLEATSYHFKTDKSSTKKSIGFIAQEVEKINPNWVVTPETDEDHYLINYNNFTVLSVKAIQEQQAMIDLLKEEVAELKKAMTELSEK